MEKPVSQKARQLLEKENWNEITFSWAGKTKKLKAHYYRIQGQSFLIEYDNSQNNGNHIHAVWREFKGDFGKDLIREHYLKGRDTKKRALLESNCPVGFFWEIF